jgi:hypothetical protein
MNRESIEGCQFPEIASEIIAMSERDQVLIGRVMDSKGDFDTGEIRTLIELHTERMHKIIEEIGWPTISKVGEHASKMAWLLVQHADHDVNFQNECLELMKKETPKEVLPVNVAYLEDRVAIKQNRPQKYGTQFHTKSKEEFGPFPILDPERVNEFRNSVGLGNIEEYASELRERYKLE